jgi:magnesium chelatase family protein
LAEALETTRLHRVAGRTGARTALVTTRRFRAPHHTISNVGLIDDGQILVPGEVSRAHHGVRFLDELPELRCHVLEALRQPLQTGIVTITQILKSATCSACFSRTGAIVLYA